MTDQHDDLDSATDERSGASSAAIVGTVVLVLMAVLAIVAVVAFDAEEDDEAVVVDDAPTTAPTTMLPSEPGPVEPSEPLGADSPLVGLTELEVREHYPLVRVVERDGEALPVTMDLRPGRINLSLEGDQVIGATVEGCDEVPDDAPRWLVESCDPDPDSDGPDAFGKLLAGGADGPLTLEVGTQGDQYHQGMTIEPDGSTLVVTTTGAPLAAAELAVGDVVWVWTAGECAESSPVQCDLAAVVVDRPAG